MRLRDRARLGIRDWRTVFWGFVWIFVSVVSIRAKTCPYTFTVKGQRSETVIAILRPVMPAKSVIIRDSSAVNDGRSEGNRRDDEIRLCDISTEPKVGPFDLSSPWWQRPQRYWAIGFAGFVFKRSPINPDQRHGPRFIWAVNHVERRRAAAINDYDKHPYRIAVLRSWPLSDSYPSSLLPVKSSFSAFGRFLEVLLRVSERGLGYTLLRHNRSGIIFRCPLDGFFGQFQLSAREIIARDVCDQHQPREDCDGCISPMRAGGGWCLYALAWAGLSFGVWLAIHKHLFVKAVPIILASFIFAWYALSILFPF
jgi:hypothetical protein